MASLDGHQREGLFCAGPYGTDMRLKPAAELESVKLSLIEQQTQQIFSIHFTSP
jgi:hypothetical protein